MQIGTAIALLAGGFVFALIGAGFLGRHVRRLKVRDHLRRRLGGDERLSLLKVDASSPRAGSAGRCRSSSPGSRWRRPAV